MLLSKKNFQSFAIALIAVSPFITASLESRAYGQEAETLGGTVELPSEAELRHRGEPLPGPVVLVANSQAQNPQATQQVPAPVQVAPSAESPTTANENAPQVVGASEAVPPVENAPLAQSAPSATLAPVAQSAPEFRASSPKPVQESEIAKYISGFRIKKETNESGVTHLKLIGLGHPSCLRHLRIELDRPVDDDTGMYAFRFSRRDFIGSDGRAYRADDDCSIERTRQCTRDPESGCVSINEPRTAAALGVASAEATDLSHDGKIMFRFDDLTKPEGDPAAIRFTEVPRQMGGPLEYKSPTTVQAELARRREQERNELLVSTCRGAESGKREDLNALKDMLGAEGLERHGRFIRRLEERVNRKDFEQLERKAESADTIEALNRLIDEAREFARSHEAMKSDVVRLLVDVIAKKATELESDSESNRFGAAKLKLAERALKVARELDRRNPALRRAHAIARLERYKFLANTGDHALYNDSIAREAAQTYRSVEQWAARSRDPEVAGVLRDYRQTFAQRAVPLTYATPMGPQVVGYLPGTSLDETFVRRSIEEEYQTYRNSLLRDGSSTTRGVSGGLGSGRF